MLCCNAARSHVCVRVCEERHASVKSHSSFSFCLTSRCHGNGTPALTQTVWHRRSEKSSVALFELLLCCGKVWVLWWKQKCREWERLCWTSPCFVLFFFRSVYDVTTVILTLRCQFNIYYPLKSLMTKTSTSQNCDKNTTDSFFLRFWVKSFDQSWSKLSNIVHMTNGGVLTFFFFFFLNHLWYVEV